MNKKPIRSFRDPEVYQNLYQCSIGVAKSILPKLAAREKNDLDTQLSRSAKAIPRLISEDLQRSTKKLGSRNISVMLWQSVMRR